MKSTETLTPKKFIEDYTENFNERKLFLGSELSDDERELITKYAALMPGSIKPLLEKFLKGLNSSLRSGEKEVLMNFIKQKENEGAEEIIPQQTAATKMEVSKKIASPVTDMTKRRTIMQLLIVLYGVTVEKGGLEAMVNEARKKHAAMVANTSQLFGPLLGSNKGLVEGAGVSKALNSLFELTTNTEVFDSEETNTLIRLWAKQYKNMYCRMNTEMPDTERKEKLRGKKEDIVTATATKLAEFGGYEDVEPLKAEVEALLPEAISFLRDEAITV
jgi:predicted DNA-binding protein (UPF0251 family)